VRTAAAELLTVLYDEGVGHLFVNPAMYSAPLRAALAEADAARVPYPQPVLCVHEQVALCAAHGHHLASGSPQAVMVHVEGGQLNLGSALENVQRDRIPVILFSADGHEEERGGVHLGPGTRPAAGGKWSTDLPPGADLSAFVRRGFQIARAEPAGLAEVVLPKDVLGQPAGPPSRRLPPPRPPAPDLGALDEMAGLLATAESPVIVAGRVGRNQASVQQLALLAETLGAPVIDARNRVNLPAGHLLNAGLEGTDLLATADAILLLDAELPCIPGLGPLPPHAWILQIDADCLKMSLPEWVCPVEIAVTADTAAALAPLRTLLADRLLSRLPQVHERRARLEAELRSRREAWRERGASHAVEDAADAMLAELSRTLPEGTLVLDEAAGGASMRQLDRPPGLLFRTSAVSPGWSVGAALGARMARPGMPIVALCNDTAFANGLPTAAFWSAHRIAASFLAVVLDRRPDDRGPRAGADSEVVTVARACGADVVTVSQPAAIASAMERLLASTRDGVCAVLDLQLA